MLTDSYRYSGEAAIRKREDRKSAAMQVFRRSASTESMLLEAFLGERHKKR
jgi:hypothetical protein